MTSKAFAQANREGLERAAEAGGRCGVSAWLGRGVGGDPGAIRARRAVAVPCGLSEGALARGEWGLAAGGVASCVRPAAERDAGGKWRQPPMVYRESVARPETGWHIVEVDAMAWGAGAAKAGGMAATSGVAMVGALAVEFAEAGGGPVRLSRTGLVGLFGGCRQTASKALGAFAEAGGLVALDDSQRGLWGLGPAWPLAGLRAKVRRADRAAERRGRRLGCDGGEAGCLRFRAAEFDWCSVCAEAKAGAARAAAAAGGAPEGERLAPAVIPGAYTGHVPQPGRAGWIDTATGELVDPGGWDTGPAAGPADWRAGPEGGSWEWATDADGVAHKRRMEPPAG